MAAIASIGHRLGHQTGGCLPKVFSFKMVNIVEYNCLDANRVFILMTSENMNRWLSKREFRTSFPVCKFGLVLFF